MMKNDDLNVDGKSKHFSQYIYSNKINYLTSQQCPFFSKIPKYNHKANMMGYRHKNIYHKYVYNKIKYYLSMIREI